MLETRPSVAVVVPCYNGDRYISQTLASIDAQSLRPSEVIVVDDCSRDDTCAVVRRHQAEGRLPLKLIELPRNSGGPAWPLNRAIEASSAKYVAVVEQDDLLHPHRLRRQYDALLAQPEAGMVVGRRRVFYGDAEYIWPDADNGQPQPGDEDPTYPVFDDDHLLLAPREALEQLLEANFIHSNSNVMVTRQAWTDVGGFDARWRANCDIDFALRVASLWPVLVLRNITYGYRVHEDSLWHSNQRRGLIDGYIVRLHACATRPDWTRRHRRGLRWALRDQALRAVREGQFRLALGALLRLASSP